MFADNFALDDEAYWTDPWANRKAVQGPLMQKGQEDFLIGAPKRVALDRHQTVPLAVLRVRKAQGGSPVDFRAMAVVAAWDKQSQRLSARLAFPKPPAPVLKKPAGSAGGKADSFSGDDSAMISEASTLDLAARLGLPLASGEYVATLLCLDQTTNQVNTRLVDSSAYHDAEAEAYVRAFREEQMGPPTVYPQPGQAQSNYARQPDSPDIPNQPDVALAVQRVTVIRVDRPCLLRGSYRLPIRALPPKPGINSVRPPQGQAVTALVSIGILLTGSVDPNPVVLNVTVPSYAPLEKAGGETFATGHFCFDLGALAPIGRLVQTYFIYAFSGDTMSGPDLAAFVNPVLTWKTREELAKENLATEGLTRETAAVAG